jgi:hypothetical protein
MIIITIIIIVILLFIYTMEEPKYYNRARYMPHKNYSDTFIDTYTNEVKLCPNQCPVFNFEKQKCVKGTVTTNVCQGGIFGNVAHYYRCNVFYLCTGGHSLVFTCSTDLCFDDITRTCLPESDNQCACFPASVCYDCCADDDDFEVDGNDNDEV